MNVFVTGANGRIGRSLLPELKKHFRVHCGMRRATSISQVSYGNLADPNNDFSWLPHQTDTVIHLANLPATPKANDAEKILIDTNVTATLRLARKAKEQKVRHFIFLSSIKAFGETGRTWESTDEPSSVYGKTKKLAEEKLIECFKDSDVLLTILRPPIVYGPEFGGNLQKLAMISRTCIPLPFKAATFKRSFLSVRNLNSFICYAIKNREKVSGLHYLSDGDDLSLFELVKSIRGYEFMFHVPLNFFKVIFESARIGSIYEQLFCELRCIQSSELDWRPPYAIGSELSYFYRTNEIPKVVFKLERFFSLFALIFGLPLLAIIFLLCYIDTKSPLFFQERIGKNEESFTLVKFRTMTTDTQSNATHLTEASNVTPIGKILRSLKLDELPQLWNVLKGEMSLVGPRPCLPQQEELRNLRRQKGIFALLPGVTGLAQIEGIDMSDPVKLVEFEERMKKSLNPKWYFRYILLTLIGKGRGDRTKGV